MKYEAYVAVRDKLLALARERDLTEEQTAMLMAVLNEQATGTSEPPMPPPYEGYPEHGEKGVRVYAIWDAGGHVKVGISDNPYWRVQALQAGNPRQLTVEYASRIFGRYFAYGIEQAAHAKLSAWGVGGEWFRCPVEDAIEAIKECGGLQE